MRADLLRALADALPEDTLRLGREVTGARALDGPDGGASLVFADGSTSDRFDLVVGADGIKSAVRASAFGDAPAKYSGIRIVFGCTAEGDESASVSARDPAEHGEVHQWFGDGCYTLVYTAGGGETRRDAAKTRQHNIAVCVSDEPSTDENAEWTRAGGNDAAKTDADAKAACLRAIDAYDMPEDVRRVAERCDRFFDVGVHYHDPLPRWRDASGAVVLAGDSCHAMPPFLGQGANQSLQDAWCLAERLSKVGGAYGDVKEALDAYESTRKPPTEQIMLSSRLIGSSRRGGDRWRWRATPRSSDSARWASRGKYSSRTRCPCWTEGETRRRVVETRGSVDANHRSTINTGMSHFFETILTGSRFIITLRTLRGHRRSQIRYLGC